MPNQIDESVIDHKMYPHQGSEDVTPSQLGEDFAVHPEAYHPALHPHIKNILSKHALDNSLLSEGNESDVVNDNKKTPKEIIDILDGAIEGSLGVIDAEVLLDAGCGDAVARNLNRFTGLDHNDIATRLIDAGQGYAVADNLNSFTGLDHNDIATRLIDAGQGGVVAYNFNSFTGLDHNDIATRLIDADRGYAVADNLNSFTGLNTGIANKLIDAGCGGAVARNLNSFTGLDHNDIATRLIDAGQGGVVAYNFNSFTGLNTGIANKLIDAGQAYAVAYNLNRFTGLDHNDIATRLIDAGQGYAVARNLNSFTGLDRAILTRLVSDGHALPVLQHPNAFSVSLSEILHGMTNDIKDSSDIADAVVENILSYHLSETDLYDVLQACTAHYSTAQKVLQLDLDNLVGDNAQKLREMIANVKPELHGVKNNHPYRAQAGDTEHVTMTLPGSELHKRASEISKELRASVETDQTLVTIREHFEDLRTEFSAKYDKEYTDRMFGKSKNLNDMFPMYRRLVADYLALCEADKIAVNLEDALYKANKSFLQVLRVDVDYYDKLFAEWDAKRIGQQQFQEVFLGRDGVYAYVGRKAQIMARRRALGVVTSDFESPEYDLPTYLVYPRGFRDGLDQNVKSVYLQQHISSSAAAHYYDTGFTGTIPEDIMSVLGVDRSEWEKHIRLLSANKRDRTVLGLKGDKSERDQIVNTVEQNVKDEESAGGLYRRVDKEGQERLAPYAQPTSPTERLAFRFTQMALHRHYYYQESARIDQQTQRFDTLSPHSERSMKVDSQIETGDKEALQTLFGSDDVGAQLLEKATALKIADPNDPYPDEAVFELTLPSGEKAIVKNVVSSQQDGPVDEFEALLLLQRLNIDAPKPIARVFTDRQKGFVVMDHLEGYSGRSIKKYFAEHNVPQDNQRAILDDAMKRIQEIADRVRRDSGLDKPWRLKDFMIEYDTDTDGSLRIKSMKPIDFERAKVFDPRDPCSVKLGQDLDT